MFESFKCMGSVLKRLKSVYCCPMKGWNGMDFYPGYIWMACCGRHKSRAVSSSKRTRLGIVPLFLLFPGIQSSVLRLLRYTVCPRRGRVVKVNCLQFNREHTYSQVVLVVSVAIKLSLMLPNIQPPTHVPFPLHHYNEPSAPSFMCTFVPFCRVCRLRLLLAYISRTD